MSSCAMILLSVFLAYSACWVDGTDYKNKKRCHFMIDDTTEDTLPLILQNNTGHLDFIVPDEDGVSLNENQNFVLACPGSRNALLTVNSNVTKAECVDGETIKVYKKEYDFDKFQCKYTAKGTVKKSKKQCGNEQGHIIHIGYQVVKKEWTSLIDVCYSDNKGITLYSEHTLYGASIKDLSKITARSSFSNAGLPSDVTATIAYKRAYQKSTFNKLLGSAGLAEKYITKSSYLARGHLSPVADFAYPAWQASTYFYINACPQWQTVNAANWLSLENAVRRSATKRSINIKVFTGTHGVLTLPDVNNNDKKILLVSDKKLPVPKYMWKIAYHEDSHEGIAFVALNNPFAQKGNTDVELCKDICNHYGWGSNSWNDYSKGFIYCCDVNEFQKVVDVGLKLKTKNVLHE